MTQQTITITFPGRLDTLTCQKLEPEILESVENSDLPIIFDMTGVDFIASSFLRICLRMVKEHSGRAFSVANVTPQVKKVFMIAGLQNLLGTE